MSDFIKKGSQIDNWINAGVDKINKKLDVKEKPKTKAEIINTNVSDRLDSIDDTLKQLVQAIIKLIEDDKNEKDNNSIDDSNDHGIYQC